MFFNNEIMSVQRYVEMLAAELEKVKEINIPEWAKFVKTSPAKERPPEQKNWWYLRAASILRKIKINKEIGVNRLRRTYGSRKNYGHAPEHKVLAGGKIIRTILQQLEKAGLIEKTKRGRRITKLGNELLNNVRKKVERK